MPESHDTLTFTAVFPDGHTATRTRRARFAPFTHAAMKTSTVSGPGGRTVTFHTSEEDARAFATKRGKVVAVTSDAPVADDSEEAAEAERAAKTEDAIVEYGVRLLSGRQFQMAATSCAGIIGYQPPTQASKYADCVRILAAGAGKSDRQAKLVARVIGQVPLHNTAGASMAALWQAAAEAVGAGYFDTVGNAGPEAGRRSDHEHAYTLQDVVVFYNTCAEAAGVFEGGRHSVGWCLQALLEREGINEGDWRLVLR